MDRESKRVLAAQVLGDDVEVWSPKANQDGYYLNENGKVVYSEEARQRKLREHLKRCGIPEKFFDLTLENFTVSMTSDGQQLSRDDEKRKAFAKRIVAAYASRIVEIAAGFDLTVEGKKRVNRVRHLLLDGGNGSGKTMLGAIVAVEAAKKGLVVRFFRYGELMFMVNDTYEDREGQRDLLHIFRRADVIIVDGIAPRTDDEGKAVRLALPMKEGLERLSELRADSGKPTVLTCIENMDFDGHPFEAMASSCHRLRLPGAVKARDAQKK